MTCLFEDMRGFLPHLDEGDVRTRTIEVWRKTKPALWGQYANSAAPALLTNKVLPSKNNRTIPTHLHYTTRTIPAYRLYSHPIPVCHGSLGHAEQALSGHL